MDAYKEHLAVCTVFRNSPIPIAILCAHLVPLTVAQMIPPVTDSFGRVIEASKDLWEGRLGIAVAVDEIAPHLDPDSVVQLMSFFVKEGLGDREQSVGKAMLKAALTAVEAHGKVSVAPSAVWYTVHGRSVLFCSVLRNEDDGVHA